MALNYFGIDTSRRLALGIFVTSGTLLLTALNIVSDATIADKASYASDVSSSLSPLGLSVLGSLMALMFVEIGAHPETPEEGHPHSRNNYLQSAFAMIISIGLIYLVYGGYRLITVVEV